MVTNVFAQMVIMTTPQNLETCLMLFPKGSVQTSISVIVSVGHLVI
jgi:hypothetical protein